jgi:serine/threonine protein kinase
MSRASRGRSLLKTSINFFAARLLLKKIGGGRLGGLFLQGQMHALMTPVLLRMTGLSLVVVQEPVVLCALRAFSPSDYYDPMLESIGHYQIRRKIGQGGMGVVYEGWDDRLKRSVAIKAIPEGTERQDARGRLWREARSLARVNVRCSTF